MDEPKDAIEAINRSTLAAERQAAALEAIAERLDDLLDVVPRAIVAAGALACPADYTPDDIVRAADAALAALLKHGKAER